MTLLLSTLIDRIATRPPAKYIKAPPIKAVQPSSPPVLVAQPLVLKDKGLLDTLRDEYRKQLDPESNRWKLFKASSPDYTPAGSILTVSYYENTSSNRVQHFTGFLLAIRRHRATPTIMLRAIVDSCPVEQVFQIHSPLIKNIKCEKRATMRKGRKLYWVRDNPEWISRFTNPNAPNQPYSKKPPIPERLYDVVLRGKKHVDFDRRHGVFYKSRIINKRKN